MSSGAAASPALPVYANLWEQVLAVLRVNGVIPRRAVLLPDGSLCSKTQARQLPEVELLSRLCEVTSHAVGAPVYPRHTAELVQLCLDSNCPGAWEAARDDLMTGDLDLEAAAVVVRQGSNAAALVACLVGARDAHHLLHVCALLARALDVLDDDTRADMGRAIGCQLRAIVDAFAVNGCALSRDVRDDVLSGFGKVLARATVPSARVADVMEYALSRRRDELLRLFMHLPVTYLDHRPQLLPALLERARLASDKYPCVALLARIFGARPSLGKGLESKVCDIACGALADLGAADPRAGAGAGASTQGVDCRLCLAVGALGTTLHGESGELGGGQQHRVVTALARALACVAAHRVTGSAGEPSQTPRSQQQ
jgi:hypothetical protein